ncbi:MAG: transporter substrate-binding domain-containing protein [Rhizobiaceae bacterium]
MNNLQTSLKALFLLVLLAFWPLQSLAQEAPRIPNFWDPQERFIKPNVKDMPRLRFLTTTDFPPFSFIDKDKRLAGFHVDLARAICEELEVSPVCQIQALPFDQLQPALMGGKGDAVMGGMAVSEANRNDLIFSRPYFRLPARFVGKAKAGLSEPLITALASKSVGVVDGTAHAAFAKAKFGNMHLQLFETQEAALSALKEDKLSAVFADGLGLSFWLQTEQKRAFQAKKKPCCQFIGGPYLSETYFGGALRIALGEGNEELEQAINFALRSINDKGRFTELYLRYFPISLY